MDAENPIEEIKENINQETAEAEQEAEQEVAAVEQEEPPSMMGALKSFGFAAIMIGGAYYFYITMTAYENGEEVRMLSVLLIAYKILGKTIPAVILGLLGVFMAFGGVNEIKQASANKT